MPPLASTTRSGTAEPERAGRPCECMLIRPHPSIYAHQASTRGTAIGARLALTIVERPGVVAARRLRILEASLHLPCARTVYCLCRWLIVPGPCCIVCTA